MLLRSLGDAPGWPVVLNGKAATLVALHHQLNESQWWSAEKLRAAQFQQLRRLVAHAARNVPFYSQRLAAAGIRPGVPLTEEMWGRLPILTRAEVRDAGESLHAVSYPPAHGGVFVASTGGSTGVPVRVRKTDFADLMWEAALVREEHWHREDPDGTIGRIRGRTQDLSPADAAAVNSPHGLILSDWGLPANLLWRTGKMGIIDYRQPLRVQAAFLRRLRPHYIYTHPSHLRLLLGQFRAEGEGLPSLRAVWTVSELVDEPLREACQDIFGCRIVSNYSSAEIGYIALQCPTGPHLHVHAEGVTVEILDAAGRPCAPGEVGRVIVTNTMNYAMPLLRYEIGDEAVLGEPCACGRGLPVLSRIVGRGSDYVVLRTGERRRFNINHYRLSRIEGIQEFQLAQRSLERIELLLVLLRPLTDTETASVNEIMAAEFGADFQCDVTIHQSLPRTEAGKLRPFISDVLQAP